MLRQFGCPQVQGYGYPGTPEEAGKGGATVTQVKARSSAT